ncbi:MAG TPA: hypothetical protein VN806_08590 [Caulobacteraceae bacterium]|nr:hypothetical protein [Caulobacteraceae bacterium]
MGDEIAKTRFGAKDFARFEGRLRAETELLRDLSERQRFSDDGFVLGFEIEAWLLDHGCYPNPINASFLETMANPLVVPELSRFNVELNCDPLPLTGDVLGRTLASLSDLWSHCNRVAHSMDANIVLIGTLPILRDHDLSLAHISPFKRYAALNRQALKQRAGRPLVVDIEGEQHLRAEHHDVMLEAATTSFQVHLKTPAHLAHRYYNASLMASAVVLAAGVNAPYVFGLDLWRETRIPLFEQSVPLTDAGGGQGRVTFGTGYAQGSLTEVFEDNLAYPALLPILFDDPPEALSHLRLHNGTIWRWNRPLVGFEPDGSPHLRIEHRTLPSGPTMIDMVANAALYLGLVRSFVDDGFDEGGLSFADARDNLYAAARYGLDAELAWPGAGRIGARTLLLDELLTEAHEGLASFGIDAGERERFLGVIEARVRSGQTGAAWQRAALGKFGDLRTMMAAYCEGQRSGVPVHEWEL